eukprot:3696824-Amphidinium_carterae.1
MTLSNISLGFAHGTMLGAHASPRCAFWKVRAALLLHSLDCIAGGRQAACNTVVCAQSYKHWIMKRKGAKPLLGMASCNWLPNVASSSQVEGFAQGVFGL